MSRIRRQSNLPFSHHVQPPHGPLFSPRITCGPNILRYKPSISPPIIPIPHAPSAQMGFPSVSHPRPAHIHFLFVFSLLPLSCTSRTLSTTTETFYGQLIYTYRRRLYGNGAIYWIQAQVWPSAQAVLSLALLLQNYVSPSSR